MDARHETDRVDHERRAALLLGLAGMSVAVVGQGREASAQQAPAGQAMEATPGVTERVSGSSIPDQVAITSIAPPRFAVGEAVRISQRFPVGHYRTPMYARGKVGRIERVLPEFLNPEQEGYGKNAGTRIRLYRVRLKQAELWPDYTGNPNDELQIEIYEHWLEPA